MQAGVAANKFSSGLAAFSNVFTLLRNKTLTIREIAIFFVLACCGGGIGALITSRLSEQMMNVVAIVLLTLAFVLSISKIEMKQVNQKQSSSTFTYIILVAVGAYDGGFLRYFTFLEARNFVHEGGTIHACLNFWKLSRGIYYLHPNGIFSLGVSHTTRYRFIDRGTGCHETAATHFSCDGSGDLSTPHTIFDQNILIYIL
ncbi:sulfite exporter TauE/SafE family protein [Hazenella sp. IB182353]|uniref:TSUP family transporter n=1 Tax=Polycladospora coralii TaxID=2771432 RepID=UPI0017476BF0|nr:sulfite exporter TauE/SafE family protein [Polycladospora coralii]